MKGPFPRQAFVIAPELLEQADVEGITQTFFEMSEAGLTLPPFDEFDVTVPFFFSWGFLTFETFIKNIDKQVRELPEHRHNQPESVRWKTRPQQYPNVFRFRRAPRYSENVGSFPDVEYTFFPQVKGDPVFGLLDKHQRGQAWTHLGSIEAETEIERRDPDGNADFSTHAHRAAHRLYALLIVCLVSKGISQTTRENKLAKLGIGKPGKRPYAFTTYISPAWRAYDGEDGSDRGPVRPHFRRGHVRKQHYGPGRELVRTVFIRPVWVNMELGEPATRDHYRVSAAPGAEA